MIRKNAKMITFGIILNCHRYTPFKKMLGWRLGPRVNSFWFVWIFQLIGIFQTQFLRHQIYSSDYTRISCGQKSRNYLLKAHQKENKLKYDVILLPKQTYYWPQACSRSLRNMNILNRTFRKIASKLTKSSKVWFKLIN